MEFFTFMPRLLAELLTQDKGLDGRFRCEVGWSVTRRGTLQTGLRGTVENS